MRQFILILLFPIFCIAQSNYPFRANVVPGSTLTYDLGRGNLLWDSLFVGTISATNSMLGTITTGIWNGAVIGIPYGGSNNTTGFSTGKFLKYDGTRFVSSNYDSAGFLKNADSTSNRTYSNLIYLKNADSTSQRTYTNNQLALKLNLSGGTLTGDLDIASTNLSLGVSSSSDGAFKFRNATNAFLATLKGDLITGSSKSFSLPNTSGTLALTSDSTISQNYNTNRFALKLNISDTASMLSPYLKTSLLAVDTAVSSTWSWNGSTLKIPALNLPRLDKANTFAPRQIFTNGLTTNDTVFAGRFSGLRISGNDNSFNYFIGTNTGTSITSGQENTAFGYKSFESNTSGSFNAAFGEFSLQKNLTGYDNVAIGIATLRHNTTGFQNVAIGTDALDSNTTGNYNVAVGEAALYDNKTGSQNIAVGAGAMQYIVGGNYNIGIGNNALQNHNNASSNVAIGNAAMRENTTGFENAAFGHASLDSNSTGSGNTALGSASLYSNYTGNYNIGIGYFSGGRYSKDLSNRLYVNSLIRPNLLGDTTLSIIYGYQDSLVAKQRLYLNANVSISGTLATTGAINGNTNFSTSASPTLAGLTLNSTTRPQLKIQGSTGGGQVMRFVQGDAGGYFNWQIGSQYNYADVFEITPSTAADGTTFSTPAFRIDRLGNQVNSGTGQFTTVRGSDTVKAGTLNGATYSYIIPGGALVQSSDESLKENIRPFTVNLANFSKVSPRKYNFKEKNFYQDFDEKSVPDSVDVKIDSVRTKRVSNKKVKDAARSKFISDNLADSKRRNKIEYSGFLANEFNPQILGKQSKEINSADMTAVMWLKIQELETRVAVLEKK